LVEAGIRPNDAGLLRAVDAQLAALAVLAQPESHMALAYLSVALAGSIDQSPSSADELLSVGQAHLRQSLALAPGQPRAWFMLAGLYERSGDLPSAADALDLSLRADPHAPMFAPFRWPMALKFGKLLDRTARERANLEFLSYFRDRPQDALRQALRLNRFPELRALVSGSEDDVDRLRRAERRLQRGD
ncbi:MAG: tetratricopeptide repeat protein, partial [Geminicoccaceae bacterium]